MTLLVVVWLTAVLAAAPALAAPQRDADNAYQELRRAQDELAAVQIEVSGREAELAATERNLSAALAGSGSTGEALRAARSAAVAARSRVAGFYSGVSAEFRRGREFAVLDNSAPLDYRAALPLLDFVAADQFAEVRAAEESVRQAEFAVTASADALTHAEAARTAAADALAAAGAHREAALRDVEDAQRRVDALSPVGEGDAGNVVRFALAQLGKPYVWGAEGPGSYDCSGLVLAAFRSVGLTVPRTSALQAGVGVPVPRDQVRPGDLVFYYQPVSHVAVVIDESRAVHLSRPGEPVRIADIDAIGPVSGIRRLLR
ncbi:hydrolase Nlp/P60 [Amycolatopsis deserti]|uniref:Hydrolase Nlp/P60 n=1 Tax=Amycolatopsis deserti TaxID=185696 RepID=A0ABQ3JE80_9PSEU|nr:C40 family peptidase [Amycolatopsis deserti]GHF16761.1 hydrolase Nlp/P60 [Amycolatopsis deserti]